MSTSRSKGALTPPVLALALLLGACSGVPDAGCPGAAGHEGVFLPAADSPCELLSSYGLFEPDPAGRPVPAAETVAYDVRTPLFSDYALKYRQIWMPAATRAAYRERGVFDFPVGTILVKTFAYPADLRRPDDDLRLLETRLLIHRDDGWQALSYSWNDAGTEAHLEPLGGRRHVAFVHTDGGRREVDYLVPNVSQCAECHARVDVAGDSRLEPLGPSAAQLNLDYPYPEGEENQIARLARLGWLESAPPDLAAAPRLAAWDQPSSGSLDERARAYLDANCGHCHRPEGTASTSGLVLSAEEAVPRRYGVCKVPIRSSEGGSVDLLPGDPERSDLVHRMESLDPRQAMPKIARTLRHDEGVALVREWVTWLGTEEAARELGLENPECS